MADVLTSALVALVLQFITAALYMARPAALAGPNVLLMLGVAPRSLAAERREATRLADELGVDIPTQDGVVVWRVLEGKSPIVLTPVPVVPARTPSNLKPAGLSCTASRKPVTDGLQPLAVVPMP